MSAPTPRFDNDRPQVEPEDENVGAPACIKPRARFSIRRVATVSAVIGIPMVLLLNARESHLMKQVDDAARDGRIEELFGYLNSDSTNQVHQAQHDILVLVGRHDGAITSEILIAHLSATRPGWRKEVLWTSLEQLARDQNDALAQQYLDEKGMHWRAEAAVPALPTVVPGSNVSSGHDAP